MRKNIITVLRRICLLMTFAALCGYEVNAQTPTTYNFTFSKDDFSLMTKDGVSCITSSKHTLMFSGDTLQPAVPYVNLKILLPKGSDLNDVSMSVKSKQSMGECILMSNPKVVRMDLIEDSESAPNDVVAYDRSKIYPSQQICDYSLGIIDGYRVAYISFTPFVYDASKKSLSLITSVDIHVKTASAKAKSAVGEYSGRGMRELVKKIVSNPNDLEKMYENAATQKKNRIVGYEPYDCIDYLVITADSLKSAFDDLLMLKRTKGLVTHILSVEEVYNNFNGADLQEKIKNCLRHYYTNYGLRYALLGGDDNIIPVRYCGAVYMDKYPYKDWTDSIPSDLYYSCFDKTFNWDGDGNGVYGEETDDADTYPDIILSRLPVRNSKHIVDYTSKLVKYERGDDYSSYMDKLLFAGFKAYVSFDEQGVTKSDAHLNGEYILDNSIKPYYNGNIDYLFDTGTNIDGYPLGTGFLSDLRGVLNKGYNIVNVDTHGGPNCWKFGEEHYTTDDVVDMKKSASFIITSACLTNNFTAQEPCLSEVFIRSPKSGTVGYWGGSWTVWGSQNNLMGSIHQMMNSFYENIFVSDIRCFGEAVMLTQTEYGVYTGHYYPYRWNALALNAIGDPDVSINLQPTKEFSDVIIKRNDETGVTVDTGVDGCCVKGFFETENGEIYTEIADSGRVCSLETFGEFKISVSINKPGYKSFYTDLDFVKDLYFQNVSFTGNDTYKAKNIRIGYDFTADQESRSVIIPSGKSVKMKISNGLLIGVEFECEKGAEFTVEKQ